MYTDIMSRAGFDAYEYKQFEEFREEYEELDGELTEEEWIEFFMDEAA